MIVADTNLIAYFYLPSDFRAQAHALYLQDSNWVVPVLWRSEFKNILAGYFRRGTLSFDEIVSVQHEAEALFRGREYQVSSLHVLQLVQCSDCSAYDCEFVSLAMQLGVKLVTMDKRVLRNFPEQTLKLITENTK